MCKHNEMVLQAGEPQQYKQQPELQQQV
jgi:hypothetical protein